MTTLILRVLSIYFIVLDYVLVPSFFTISMAALYCQSLHSGLDCYGSTYFIHLIPSTLVLLLSMF